MLMISNALYIQYFYDVVQLGSFSKAAEKHFITQSAVSQAVKKLESSCEQTFIYHHQNRLHLTPEGDLFFEKAADFLKQFSYLESFVESLAMNKIKKVHFGCMHSLALALVPRVIQAFKKKYPESIISFELGNGAHLLHRVKSGELDFAIVLDNDDLSYFYTVDLYRGTHEVFEGRDCSSKGLIISEQSFESKLFIQLFQRAYNRSPQIDMKVASWEVIASLTESGIGLGYFPDYLLYHHKNVKSVKYSFDSLQYRLKAVFRSKENLSTHSEAFLMELERCLVDRQGC
jgi:DNA-binding transcriptional LysR family regulator